MNQLFYNIAGGIEHQIRREKRTTISEVIVRVKRNIMQNRNWFYFEFLLKVRVLYFAIFKRKNLSLPLKVETDQFVICLVLPECLSVKICCISPLKRIVMALMSSLFRCFSLFLPHLRTLAQEKTGRKLSSFWDWWVQSLFLSIIVAKYLNIFPHANNGRSREKKISRAIRVHYRDLEHALRILNLIAWLC